MNLTSHSRRIRMAHAGSEVASIAVLKGPFLLMGRRRDNMRWTLPGGHLDPGEDPIEGAKRELFEEAGIRSETLYPLGCEDVTTFSGLKKRIHAFKLETYDQPRTVANDPDHEVYVWEWVDISKGLPALVAQYLHSPKNVVLRLLGLQSGA